MMSSLTFATPLLGNETTTGLSDECAYCKFEIQELAYSITLGIALGVLTIVTIIGNCFVFMAILLEPKLRNVSNYLICSLAVADLTVATLVMPISIIKEISRYWFMGRTMCDIFLIFDIFCCTASILNLVAISFDRYWAVTDIRYIQTRTPRRIFAMMSIAWGLSLGISSSPVLGWRGDSDDDPDKTGKCMITQDLSYTVFSTVGAFFLPCIVMMIMYVKIYRVAKARIQRRAMRKQYNKALLAPNPNSANGSAGNALESPEATEMDGVSMVGIGASEEVDLTPNSGEIESEQFQRFRERERQKEKIVRETKRKRHTIEYKREKKASRTLAIITGCFMFCWLPFFTMALSLPFCGKNCINSTSETFYDIFTWLGYVNSALNPVIYTVFNVDFRNAFKKIIFGQYRERRYRPTTKRRPRHMDRKLGNRMTT